MNTKKKNFLASCLSDYLQFHVNTDGYYPYIKDDCITFEDEESCEETYSYYYDGRQEGKDIILSRKDKIMISVLHYLSVLEELL